jgi:hypothetical protein
VEVAGTGPDEWPAMHVCHGGNTKDGRQQGQSGQSEQPFPVASTHTFRTTATNKTFSSYGSAAMRPRRSMEPGQQKEGEEKMSGDSVRSSIQKRTTSESGIESLLRVQLRPIPSVSSM